MFDITKPVNWMVVWENPDPEWSRKEPPEPFFHQVVAHEQLQRFLWEMLNNGIEDFELTATNDEPDLVLED